MNKNKAMKKIFLWMLTAILTCGLTLISLTSCSDDDDSTTIKDTNLSGSWFAQIKVDEKSPDCENYALLTFDKNGVVTTRSYEIYPNEPINYSERFRRHEFYNVNEAAGTFTIQYDDAEEEDALFYYSFNKEGMVLKQAGSDLIIQLHRPTYSELKMLSVFDKVISSDDYVGKWINEKNEAGIMKYTVMTIDEDGIMDCKVYLTNEDKCQCVPFKFYYSEYDTKEHNGQVIEMHPYDNYKQVSYWWWTVKDNILTTGPADIEGNGDSNEDEDEDEIVSYRAFTPADKVLIDKLESMLE